MRNTQHSTSHAIGAFLVLGLVASFGFTSMEKLILPDISEPTSSYLSSSSSYNMDVSFSDAPTNNLTVNISYSGPISGPSSMTLLADTSALVVPTTTTSVTIETSASMTVTTPWGVSTRSYIVFPPAPRQ